MTKKKRRAWRRKRGLKGSEGNEPEALPLAVVADKVVFNLQVKFSLNPQLKP